MLLNLNRNDAKFNEELVLSTNSIDIGIQKFDDYPSVILIRDNIKLSDMFQFENVFLNGILKEITNLNTRQNGTFKKHSNLLCEGGCGIYSSFLTQI